MSQTQFEFLKIDGYLKDELLELLEEINSNLEAKFVNFSKYQEVLANSSHYSSQDIKDNQQPEEFTKRTIIEPLIEFLGYQTVPETSLSVPFGRREPDYVISPKDENEPIFYVEAEHLNCNLYQKGYGVSQANEWLLSRASITDYGIATDGLKWILIKFDPVSAMSKEVFTVDLREYFLYLLNPVGSNDESKLKEIIESFLQLHTRYINGFLKGYISVKEKNKEEISKQFYNDYVRNVFGYDKYGNRVKGLCLLDTIIGGTEQDASLFSVVLMNRLIFIKFLEEWGIVPDNLLRKLLDIYGKSGVVGTFYDSNIKPLFYDVFNREKKNRRPNIKQNHLYNKIPYLNGGLFREIIENERQFNVENRGLELIIDNLFDKYKFGKEDSQIDPDILGYIFEKTINFISGTGTDKQKMKGAYYTPDDVVEFIIEKTVTPIIFNKMIEGLENAGWTERDLKGYDSIEDILKNLPPNPIHIKEMLKAIKTIKVIDPACGSGHFLTTVLSQLLRVEEHLLRTINEDFTRYELKREIISNNLFGVDIDENAVEIARLRLWLSLIYEVEISSHISTLPNIDFKILVGNSLIGWLDENVVIHPLENLLDYPYVEGALEGLSVNYGNLVDKTINLLEKRNLSYTIRAYKNLLDIYSTVSGEKAVKLRNLIEGIRSKLYDLINNAFLAYLKQNSKISQSEQRRLSRGLSERKPFHWKIDFENILLKDGFDVVLGNPPYIEDRLYDDFDLDIIELDSIKIRGKKRINEGPLLYDSKDCGNTYAYFIERSLNLLAKQGKFGFIVPVALVSTERMSPIRKVIHSNSSDAEYYNFDDRPGKIFSGLEHCRSTIVITSSGEGTDKILTSKYHRWYTENRDRLFKKLKKIKYSLRDKDQIIPKIGTEMELKLLQKIRNTTEDKTIEDSISTTGEKVWYYDAPLYWIHAHTKEYLPATEYYDSYEETEDEVIPLNFQEEKVSTHYKSLILENDNNYVISSLLNSSLFYWWFVIWSDGRDLLKSHVTSFPINLKEFPKDLKKELKELAIDLMKDYEANTNKRINRRSGGYAIIIKEIIPQKSKEIIDKIDDILSKYYKFTEKELEFIKNFDIKFRMSN